MAPAKTDVTALRLQGATVHGRLHDVNLSLMPGIMAGLVGPNGAGKSTLLQVAAGLLPAGPSTVTWDGRELHGIPVLERGRAAAWVPQEARFEFGFTVRSVVAQGRFAYGDDQHGVDDILEKMDLAALAQRPVNRLSGGERQRVLLARALVTRARLQLWDEPLAPLDPRHALEIMMTGRELARSGTTLLFSLHDLRMAFCLDFVVVLHQGCLRAAGPPAEVLTAELLREVFGVKMSTVPGLVMELPDR